MFLKIGQVSKLVGLSIKRIREYEKEGLVKPVRGKTSNQRMYGSFEIGRIQQIKKLIHERGMTLAGIKTLLNLAPCWTVFGCKNHKACAAYSNPHIKCYEVKDRTGEEVFCHGNCAKCPVYMTREDFIAPIFPDSAQMGESSIAAGLA